MQLVDDPGHTFCAWVIYKHSTHRTCSRWDWALADFYSTIYFLITRWCQNSSSSCGSMSVMMTQRNLFACSLFYLIHYCRENAVLQRLIDLLYVYSGFFFYYLFMTVTQQLCSIRIITIVSKSSISITSTSISVFGPQNTI